MIGLEVLDRIGDDRQDAAAVVRSAGVGADGLHVAEHRVEALVGKVAELIHIVGKPGEPPGEGGRDHVDLSGRAEKRARFRRQVVHIRDGGVCDKQQAPDGGFRSAHGRLYRSAWGGRSVAVHVSW